MSEPNDIEICAIVRYNFARGLGIVECLAEMGQVLGADQCPPRETVFRWYQQFGDDGSFSDVRDESKKAKTVSPEIVEEAKRLVEENPRIMCKQIEERLKIGVSTVRAILRDRLGLKKCKNRWVAIGTSEEEMEQAADAEDSADFSDEIYFKVENSEKSENKIENSDRCETDGKIDDENSNKYEMIMHTGNKKKLDERTSSMAKLKSINASSESKDTVIIKEELIMDNNIEDASDDFSYLCTDRSIFNIVKEEDSLDIYDEDISIEDKSESLKSNDIHLTKAEYDTFDVRNENESEHLEFTEELNDESLNKRKTEIKKKVTHKHDEMSKINAALSIIQTTDKRYACKYCHKTYKHKTHAYRHFYYDCEGKGRPTPSKPRKYHCKICNSNLKTKYSLERHEFFLHGDKCHKSVSCGVCLKVFRDRNTLKHHLKNTLCQGAPVNEFTCNMCFRKYRDKPALRRHQNTECGKEPRFSCAHCDFRTLQKANIIMHFARLHNHEVPLTKVVCPNCKRTYKNDCTLKRHLRFECGKKPSFACDKCDYRSKRKCSLMMHIRNKHSLK